MLLPNDPQNYYRQRDIVPPRPRCELGQAKIVITNFHAFQLREKVAGRQAHKGDPHRAGRARSPRRRTKWCAASAASLGTKRNIVVFNDEAHHCYRRKPDGEDEKLTGEERVKRSSAKRKPVSGSPAMEAVKAKIGVKAIYDLSATPFFLGIGLPRRHAVPVGGLRLFADRRHRVGHRQGAARAGSRQRDDRRSADLPRSVAANSRRAAEERAARPRPSAASRSCRSSCEGALQSLYSNYEK